MKDYYEKIREIRNKHFPPKLEFGCEVLAEFTGGGIGCKEWKTKKVDTVVRNHEGTLYFSEIVTQIKVNDVIKVLGKPISLNDILRLLGFTHFPELLMQELPLKGIFIDLSKEIKDQDEEMLKIIYNLIKSK